MTEGHVEGSFQRVEIGLVEWYILNAEVASQNLNGKLFVLNPVDVFAELLDHNLLHYRFYHLLSTSIKYLFINS